MATNSQGEGRNNRASVWHRAFLTHDQGFIPVIFFIVRRRNYICQRVLSLVRMTALGKNTALQQMQTVATKRSYLPATWLIHVIPGRIPDDMQPIPTALSWHLFSLISPGHLLWNDVIHHHDDGSKLPKSNLAIFCGVSICITLTMFSLWDLPKALLSHVIKVNQKGLKTGICPKKRTPHNSV